MPSMRRPAVVKASMGVLGSLLAPPAQPAATLPFALFVSPLGTRCMLGPDGPRRCKLHTGLVPEPREMPGRPRDFAQSPGMGLLPSSGAFLHPHARVVLRRPPPVVVGSLTPRRRVIAPFYPRSSAVRRLRPSPRAAAEARSACGLPPPAPGACRVSLPVPRERVPSA